MQRHRHVHREMLKTNVFGAVQPERNRGLLWTVRYSHGSTCRCRSQLFAKAQESSNATEVVRCRWSGRRPLQGRDDLRSTLCAKKNSRGLSGDRSSPWREAVRVPRGGRHRNLHKRANETVFSRRSSKRSNKPKSQWSSPSRQWR